MTINIESNVGRNLESLVDANGMQAVLDALAAIADAKAEHVEYAWQDAGLASLWRAAARRIATTASSVAISRLKGWS